MGVIPIIEKGKKILSLAFNNPPMNFSYNNKFFISRLTKFKYGDCSLMAERAVVVRETRVRFSPFAFCRELKRGEK